MKRKKFKRRNDNIKTLDLHGMNYDQAENAVTNFVLLENFPVQIITGNSVGMKDLVFGILKKHGFYYYFKDWYNLGCLIIIEKKL